MTKRLRRSLLFAGVAAAVFGAAIATGRADQVFGDPRVPANTKSGELAPGIVVDCDYPLHRRMKNVGGSDGAGLCVFTSIEHFLDWFHMTKHLGFREWMRSKPGGGYPEKVTRTFRDYCKEKGLPMPDLLQVTTTNQMPLKRVIDLMAEAVQNGYMVGATYCYSPTRRYNGQTIAHMVNIVGARVGPGKNLWVVLDNNYIDELEWMDEATFEKVFSGNGGGWWLTLLNEADPPPIPRNKE